MYAQTLILLKLIVVNIIDFLGHTSEPCGNFWTILRHKLPIIHPNLPIPSNNLNSNVQPEFVNRISSYKTEKSSRVLAAERIASRPSCFCLEKRTLKL